MGLFPGAKVRKRLYTHNSLNIIFINPYFYAAAELGSCCWINIHKVWITIHYHGRYRAGSWQEPAVMKLDSNEKKQKIDARIYKNETCQRSHNAST